MRLKWKKNVQRNRKKIKQSIQHQDTPNEKTISNMVVITGKEQAWSEAKEYMQQLGLKVEEVI